MLLGDPEIIGDGLYILEKNGDNTFGKYSFLADVTHEISLFDLKTKYLELLSESLLEAVRKIMIAHNFSHWQIFHESTLILTKRLANNKGKKIKDSVYVVFNNQNSSAYIGNNETLDFFDYAGILIPLIEKIFQNSNIVYDYLDIYPKKDNDKDIINSYKIITKKEIEKLILKEIKSKLENLQEKGYK